MQECIIEAVMAGQAIIIRVRSRRLTDLPHSFSRLPPLGDPSPPVLLQRPERAAR
jgi:hypothetical protein